MQEFTQRLDAYYPRRTACGFLGLMERVITVLLQYVSQLINIGQTHILFDFEFFKTDLFLKYKENMGTFCSTSVNLVYQSLKAVLTELLIGLTNLHSDVNGHQKTIMGFLCSNFNQINDNIVAVKSYVATITTASDMQKNQVFLKV